MLLKPLRSTVEYQEETMFKKWELSNLFSYKPWLYFGQDKVEGLDYTIL